MHNFIVSGNSIKTIFDVKALETVHEMMQHFTDMQIQLSGCKIIAQLAMGKNNLTSTFHSSRKLCQLIVLTTYKYRHDKIDSRSSLFSFVRTWILLSIQTSKFNDKYTFKEFILRLLFNDCPASTYTFLHNNLGYCVIHWKKKSTVISFCLFFHNVFKYLFVSEDTLDLLNALTYDLMLTTMKKFIDEPNIQVVCCGTISYLASSGMNYYK